MNRTLKLAGALWLLALAGCQQTLDLRYVSSKEVLAQELDVQKAIRQELDKVFGSPIAPKAGYDKNVSVERLRRGASFFQSRCAGCHGVTGDGNGAAAEYLYPKPRDYRKGLFKFTSTPYSSKPRRDDLVNLVTQGARGTSMPSFKLYPKEDIDAVVDYVLLLTHRGELEAFLAQEADDDGKIDPAQTDGLLAQIMSRWQSARNEVILPVSKAILYSDESVELGRKAFMSEQAGCFKCHGPDGRGRTADNAKGFTDSWGQPTRAADLTSGLLHGGSKPLDIYRRVYGGIKGTPMPEFSAKLAAEPDTFWHLVHFVQHVSSARRDAVVKGVDFTSPTEAPAANPSPPTEKPAETPSKPSEG